MTALYQNQTIRALEEQVIQGDPDRAFALMQRAGSAAFTLLRQRWPEAKTLQVFAGKGNNGGDAFIVATLAQQAGMTVTVWSVAAPEASTGAALQAAKACMAAGVSILPLDPAVAFAADLIVDGLLGSGLRGDVREPYAQLITAINDSAIPVLALDVPSGLCVDTGKVFGVAIEAAATMTFIGYKPGLFTCQGPSHCGEVFYNELDITHDALKTMPAFAELLEWRLLQHALPRRQRDAHKGHYGHVLVIGGDYGMGGAVRMASEAAIRVGAGLVTVATRPEHVTVVSGSRPEIMCHKVVSGGDLDGLLARATVVVLGPGLGTSDWSKTLFNRVMESDQPVVMDADALNLLSEAKAENPNWILTPHPGEASRLLGCTCREIQDNRFASVTELCKYFGGTVVLKGVGTIVQSPGDVCPKICPAGNPGMATGGMGDVLSGVIGGLLAQGLSQAQAAELGVMIHAIAADRAAAEGGERGLLATDLMDHLRSLVNPNVE